MRLPILAAAVLTGVSAGAVPASAAPAALSAQDSSFVMNAAYAGNFEVAAGSLARARAQSQAVRDFGTMMVSDHNRAGARLAALAKDEGTTIPDLPDSAQQNIIKAWSRLDGLLFDCAYVPAEYLDHQGAVLLFQDEAAHGDNVALVRFARETLPTLQQHQRTIAARLAELDCNG